MEKDCKKTGKFSGINNDKSLALYLKKVLSRATAIGHLYQYTSFDAIKNIYLSNTLRLYKASGMNDITEANSIVENGLADNMFYSCFSLVDENAEMWNMYSKHDDGCILGIDFETARKMVDYRIQLPKDKQNKSLKKETTTLSEKPFFSSVVYYFAKEDRKNDTLECMTVYNPGYSGFNEGSELVGLVKSGFWRFEKEARLIVKTEKKYSYEYLELKLPAKFWKGCKIIISPYVTEEKINEITEYCRKHRNLKIPVKSSYYGQIKDSRNHESEKMEK